MSGGVDLDLHAAVLQLQEAPPDHHLLAEGLQELLPQLIRLRSGLLAGVGLDLRWKQQSAQMRNGSLHGKILRFGEEAIQAKGHPGRGGCQPAPS